MVKRIAIIYIIIAAVVAIVTTILQVQPALFVIDYLTEFEGKYFVKLTVLLTLGLLLVPLIFIVLLLRLFDKGPKNEMPPSLSGKTGIIVHRKKQLQDGIYIMKVFVNGEVKSGVSSGKRTFVELAQGTYKVFVKGGVNNSEVVQVELAENEIKELLACYSELTKFKSKLSLSFIDDLK